MNTTPRQAEPLPEQEALEIIRLANDSENIAELRAETTLLRWIVDFYGLQHPDGKSTNDHVQLTLLDYYLANPEQTRAECEAAGTPLGPGTLYLDTHNDHRPPTTEDDPMSTTSQTSARQRSDEETLHAARLAVIDKIAKHRPIHHRIDDPDHPILIGTTRDGAPVLLVWTEWGVSGYHDEHAHNAAIAAVRAHRLDPSKMHVYASFTDYYRAANVHWHPTAGYVEPYDAHLFIAPIKDHFADDPEQWTVRKNAEHDWHLLTGQGRVLARKTTKRAALEEARTGHHRAIWNNTHAWYLDQPGPHHAWRDLTPHERAYIRHILATRTNAR